MMFDILNDMLLPLHQVTVVAHAGEYDIALISSGREPPFDITVRAFGNLFQFAGFTDDLLGTYSGKWQRVPKVHVLKPRAADGNIFVIGWRHILCVFTQTKECKIIHELDRMEDPGFRHQWFHPIGDAFLLTHELGLARIDVDGTLRWKQELELNDIFDLIDPEAICFSGDYGKEGCISKRFSIATGDLQINRLE